MLEVAHEKGPAEEKDVSCRAMDVDSSSAEEMPTELDVRASLKTVDLLPIM